VAPEAEVAEPLLQAAALPAVALLRLGPPRRERLARPKH